MSAAAAAARDLYLDLLVKSVTNLIYGPLPADPWYDGLLRPDAQPGRDRNSPAHTMCGILRVENVRSLAQAVVDAGVPGHLVECGVWRGGCSIVMRGVLAANGVTDRSVYVADSFAGLPPPRPSVYPRDAASTFHLDALLAVDADVVRANFARYDLLDDQVVFVEGFFSETLPRLEAGPFALIRLDGDMYESTYVALDALYPKLSPGGFMIIDDYGGVDLCRSAVDDYRARFGIVAPMTYADSTAVYWQKP